MNIRDSEAVSALLRSAGHSESESINDADIVLLNTCSVRDSAERKVEGYLWKLRSWKDERDGRILCIVGCMAQSGGDDLLAKFPHLDIVAGTSRIARIPEMISNASLGYGRFSDTNDDKTPYDDMSTHTLGNGISAFIPVMRGCSMNCSYCIVPQVRGGEKSRPEEEIIKEAKELSDKGIKEIFLLGQNIAAYGLDGVRTKTEKSPFAKLLAKIAKIENVKRIRFTSPHPASFNDELINEVCENRKVCDSVHIPLQSGSDRILTLMQRKYSSSDYMRIIEKLVSGRPAISFSTDVIVGFPGETDEDFNDTRKILQTVGFEQEFIFKYSKRKNTPAAEMNEQLPDKIKEDRNQILLEDLKKRVLKKNRDTHGKTVEILLESESSRGNNRMIGKTSSNKTVIVEKKQGFKVGDFANALIEDSTLAALYGIII